MISNGKIIFVGLVIFSALVLPSRVFCYDTYVAHSNIAQRAGILFNKNNEQKLSIEQIGWIMQGAEQEDIPTRWLNHFYNPVNEFGLKGVQLSAKQWASDPEAQTRFSLGDQSWQRALGDYRKGNVKQAFLALGHVIHLVSDMTVPAHTRDDIHVSGDSFEQFVKKNWNTIYPQIKDRVIYYHVNSEVEVFELLSNFSNNIFYSDDTIQSKDFSIVHVDKKMIQVGVDGRKYIYSYSCLKNEIDCRKLFVQDSKLSWTSNFDEIDIRIKDDLVLTDYSTYLIPKAIGYSAGLIELFFKEAEKEEEVELPSVRIGLRGYSDRVVGYLVEAGQEMMYTLQRKFDVAPKGVLTAQSNSTDILPSVQSDIEGIASSPPKADPRNDNRTTTENKKPEIKKSVKSEIPAFAGMIGGVDEAIEPTENLKEVRPVFIAGVQDDNGGMSAPVYSSGGGSPYAPPSSDTPPTSSTSTPPTPTSTPPTPTSTPTTTPHVPPQAPTLAPIFSEIIFTTSTDLSVYGTCSADIVKILIDPISEIEFVAPSGTIWNYNAPLNSGQNDFSFYSVDNLNATSTASTSARVIRDNDPPPTPMIDTQDQSSASSTNIRVNIAGTDTLSPITYYDLYFSIFIPTSSPTPSYLWEPVATGTTSSIFDFVGERNFSYIFRSRAWDILGNTSPWSDEVSSSSPIRLDWSKEVVINEIAWAGTVNNAMGRMDEWLELYNNTDQDINLKGWEIDVTDKKILIPSSTDRIISAHGYFLLERTDDTTVQNISADYIFTLSRNILNTGENLKLRNPAGEIVDEVDCSNGWFGGSVSTSPFGTMARVSPLASGSDKNNWRTSRGPWLRAKAHDGLFIYGSPREYNQELKILSGTQIETELTLSKSDGPYYIRHYILPSAGTMTIEAGVEMYLPEYGTFTVNGNLYVLGTEADPVSFLPVPTSTMWANIFLTNSTANFTYTNFYRGNMEPAKSHDGALFITSSTVTLDHCSMRNNRPPGVQINSMNSNLTVKNSSISDDVKYNNRRVPGMDTFGISITGGEVFFENTLFSNFIYGVHAEQNGNLPILHKINMPLENFINVDIPWMPSIWGNPPEAPEANSEITILSTSSIELEMPTSSVNILETSQELSSSTITSQIGQP